MSDARILRANERLQAVSGGFFQLGTVLLAAAIVRIYVAQRFDLEVVAWLSVAGALVSVGWLTLGLVEAEMQDDTDRA